VDNPHYIGRERDYRPGCPGAADGNDHSVKASAQASFGGSRHRAAPSGADLFRGFGGAFRSAGTGNVTIWKRRGAAWPVLRACC